MSHDCDVPFLNHVMYHSLCDFLPLTEKLKFIGYVSEAIVICAAGINVAAGTVY